MENIDIFPVDWISEDADDHFRFVVFGKTPDGLAACLRIRFTPYFFVGVPDSWSESRTKLFLTETIAEFGAIPAKSVIVRRKSAWGFTNQRVIPVAQLAFPTLGAAKRARFALSKKKHQTYEGSLEPLVRFFHLRNVAPAGWIRATECRVPTNVIARGMDLELETTFERVSPSPVTTRPPLVFASWDIECHSASGKFPLAQNLDDSLIQISTAFQKYGDPEPYLRTVVCYRKTSPVTGADITWHDEEADVVNEWADILAREKTDVVVGYNTHQFDWKYVHGRVGVCVDDATGDELVHLRKLGRLLEGGGAVVEKELNSAAFGQNKFFHLTTPGIMQIDVLQWIRKNRNLDSYALKNVAKTYLNDQKIDLPASEIFRKFELGPDDRADIAAYAVRDTELPLQLMTKLAIFEDLTEMANAVKIPVEYISSRGQQIRVFSCLVGKARELGYVIPDDKAIAADGKFEGATVLKAKKGFYGDPIVALDFASLYPSIIRAENMSFETLVIDPRYANVPGVEYVTVDTGAMGTFKFAQPIEGQKGILPSLLDDLAKFRKAAKKQMADAKARGDDWGETLYDAAQRSFKIVMNSAYGFSGASKGFLPCVPIAASVTAVGRQMIATSAELAEKLVPGSEVIYGDTDSIMVKLGLPPDDLTEHFRVATWLSTEISKTFKPPHDLEFEKLYAPYILYSKKRYAAMKYESLTDKPKRDVKGIALVRRDNAPIVKDVLSECLDALLVDKSPAEALNIAREHVRRVLDNEHALEKFVISKTLRTDYKMDTQPHVFVARKIFQRRGFPLPSGSRVPFVYVENKLHPRAVQSSKAEDPEYAMDNRLVVDRLYYINQQLRKPLVSLLEPVDANPDTAIFDHEIIRDKLGVLVSGFKADVVVAKRVDTNAKNNQREITSFFTKKV